MSDPASVNPDGPNGRLARIEGRLDLMEREHRGLSDRMLRMEANQENTTITLSRLDGTVQRMDAKLDEALKREARQDGRRDTISTLATWLPSALSAFAAITMLVFTIKSVVAR